MPSIYTNDLIDSVAMLESWTQFAGGHSNSVFIAAVGFEQRASHCYEKWSAENRGSVAFLIEYPVNQADNAPQLERFKELSAANDITIEWITYETATFAGILTSKLASQRAGRDIVLDISSMASFVLYPSLYTICRYASDATLYIYYTEAAKYFPEQKDWDEFFEKLVNMDLVERAKHFDDIHFLSVGVDRVYEVPYFSGVNPDNLPVRTIVFPNFAFERIQYMIDYCCQNRSASRSRMEWFIGVPPRHANNNWRHNALWRMYSEPKPKHEVSTLDYKEILMSLHTIWQDHYLHESLVIATAGSKGQHLGIFFFLQMHPEVSLVVSEPSKFTAKKYSEGVGVSWQLSLGKVSEIVSALQGWNDIHYNWERGTI